MKFSERSIVLNLLKIYDHKLELRFRYNYGLQPSVSYPVLYIILNILTSGYNFLEFRVDGESLFVIIELEENVPESFFHEMAERHT